jgi:subtilase family serine protease
MACGGVALDAGATAVAAGSAVSVARVTRLLPGDAVTGALPMNQPIHVVVALKMRDRAGLDARIADNARSRFLGTAPHLLTPDRFLADHAPTAAQAQAVADYLTRIGFKNITIASNRLLVSADGTAATARDAFMTSFAQVRTHDGRIAFTNTDEVRIPSALSDKVLAVLGLQSVHMAHTFARPLQPGTVHTMTNGPHDPLEFSSIYGATGVATAAGVTVGIVTNGNLNGTKVDLSTFATNHGLAPITTQTVNTDGTGGDTSGTPEWDLDSQDIVGMGGGSVGKIIFYNIPTLLDSSLTDDFNTAVTANAAKIINVSLGTCETDEQGDGAAAAQDQIFATAVSQGQTFSVSTGDSGADECHDGGKTPSWPASSQYVVAVGGTTLSATSTTWSGETGWTGTGGSPSLFEPKPSWQGSTVPGTKRGTPDIAFDGDPNTGALVVVHGATGIYGGTSLSAPLFAGLWARVIAVKGTTIGFAGPWLFGLPTSDLHDVTIGNNGGETAKAGYDFVSGRGSMILSSAINHIGQPANIPPVANFGFSSVRLTANFTDSSTDSDGTVASHAWTFGDGATSTATNPSHAYAAAGTYSVTETVTDDKGATDSKTVSVTVATTLQVLKNAGFESGRAAPWTMPGGVLSNNPAEPPNHGVWDAWLDGKGTPETQIIWQQASLPAGWTTATLHFSVHIDTAETLATQRDTLSVLVTDTSDNVLATVATYSNLDAASGYVGHNVDLTPYIGQTIKVKFSGHENASLQTSFVLDDITLTLR